MAGRIEVPFAPRQIQFLVHEHFGAIVYEEEEPVLVVLSREKYLEIGLL
jgi:hypothetical protein